MADYKNGSMMLLQSNDDALMHGLPVASESNVFPVIPDTDSFLLVPKSNDDSISIKNYGRNKDDHHSLMMIKDDVALTNDYGNGHHAIRRFSTGDVATIPYTNVEILSQYLAAASKGSYHGYCKYGMRNEEDEEAYGSSTMKMFTDTFLGQDHHDILWNTAANFMERRRNKMSHDTTTPTKATAPSSTVSISKTDSHPFSASNIDEYVSPSLSKTIPKDNGHSPSRSEIGVSTRPKPYRHVSSSSSIRGDNVSPFNRSRNPSLSNLGTQSSSTSQLGVDSYKSSQTTRRRSVSVSKARTSPSVSELGISSTSGSLKPKKSEIFVSPVQKRGISMSKLAPSSSAAAKDIESSSTHHLLQRRSMLSKTSSTKQDQKVQSLLVIQNKTEHKSLGVGKLVQHNKSVSSSPAKHNFLRRQTISENNSTKRPTRVSNGEKGDDKKSNQHNNHVDNQSNGIANDEKKVVKEKITAKNYLPFVVSSSTSSKYEPHNKATQSSSLASATKDLKRSKYVQEYMNLRRTRARSVKSEPMGGVQSKDMHSVNSSIESCDTDIVLERNALERIQEARSTTTTAISTTRRTSTRSGALNSGDHKEKQPKKLKSRPGRVIHEFKYEITSPSRLKFKRTSPKIHHDTSSSLSKVDIKFELRRKAELAEVDVVKEADPKQEDIHEHNISEETISDQLVVGDRKSNKVKALVGAFESLISIQDSNTIPTVSE